MQAFISSHIRTHNFGHVDAPTEINRDIDWIQITILVRNKIIRYWLHRRNSVMHFSLFLSARLWCGLLFQFSCLRTKLIWNKKWNQSTVHWHLFHKRSSGCVSATCWFFIRLRAPLKPTNSPTVCLGLTAFPCKVPPLMDMHWGCRSPNLPKLYNCSFYHQWFEASICKASKHESLVQLSYYGHINLEMPRFVARLSAVYQMTLWYSHH